MADISRSDVAVDLKDVLGNTITDKVEIKSTTCRVQSDKVRSNVRFNQGQPAMLPTFQLFPLVRQKIVIQTKYRFKQRFINVQAGEINKIKEYFFVEPDQSQTASD